jgi:hypothetical protein
MSPDQAREYSRRWTQVGLQEAAELRTTSPELKLQQLAALLASRNLFPADPLREQEKRATRERWQKLRLALAGG